MSAPIKPGAWTTRSTGVKRRETIMWTDDAGNGVTVVVGASGIGLDVGPVDSLSDGYLLEFADADFAAWVDQVVLPARELARARVGRGG